MEVNREDSSELNHRTTQRVSHISAPTTPFMGIQNFGDVKRGTTNSKSSAINSGSRRRPILAIRTISPLVRRENDNRSYTSPVEMRHNLDSVPDIWSSTRYRQLGGDTSLANDQGRKGKAKTDDLFQHGAKETKRKRNEPAVSSKIRDILEWRAIKLEPVHIEDNDGHGNAKKASTKRAAGSMRDLWKGRQIKSPKDKGPKAGQLYEIVNRHIVEDSADKTITISTWRERDDEGQGSDADNKSIYYVSPDGYTYEGLYAAEANGKFGRRLPESKHRSKRENQGTVVANSGPSSTLGKRRENYEGYRYGQYNDIGGRITDPLQQKNGTLSASNKQEHTRSRLKEGSAGRNSSPWTQDGPFIQRHRQYLESTPIEKELPPPPFHPTCSGSTISSIRSVSTADFEKFLDGCKPSLVHVSDILESLGIYKLEHLKAVARLSPETRDREVREDALKLGMTVMEWAILVDKMLTDI